MTTILKTSNWSSHETRVVDLWLTNDESSYELLKEAYRHGSEDYEHAEWLEMVLRDARPDVMWGDLLQSAFDRVNWLEVIENNKELV